jgi:hypothetical protein
MGTAIANPLGGDSPYAFVVDHTNGPTVRTWPEKCFHTFIQRMEKPIPCQDYTDMRRFYSWWWLCFKRMELRRLSSSKAAFWPGRADRFPMM